MEKLKKIFRRPTIWRKSGGNKNIDILDIQTSYKQEQIENGLARIQTAYIADR